MRNREVPYVCNLRAWEIRAENMRRPGIMWGLIRWMCWRTGTASMCPRRNSKPLVGTGAIEGQKVILVKPQTFMNLSGDSLRMVCDFYKIDPEEELIVIYDDISPGAGTDPGAQKR